MAILNLALLEANGLSVCGLTKIKSLILDFLAFVSYNTGVIVLLISNQPRMCNLISLARLLTELYSTQSCITITKQQYYREKFDSDHCWGLKWLNSDITGRNLILITVGA